MTGLENRYHIDLLAHDKAGRPVLLGEIKGHEAKDHDATAQLELYLGAFLDRIPFVLLADPVRMIFFRWDGRYLSQPVCTLSTTDVLRHYDPTLGSQRIFAPYLRTLVEAWIHDLAYHWKMARPPASDELAQIDEPTDNLILASS